MGTRFSFNGILKLQFIQMSLCFTRAELEPTTYSNQGEHANHYTNDDPTGIKYEQTSLEIGTREKTWASKSLLYLPPVDDEH
jgi:hypothetical protein